MDYFEKNRSWKDFFISFLLLLAIAVVIFSFIGVSEGATNKDTVNKGPISKNLKIKSVTISNSTVGGLNGAVDKSKSGATIYLKKGVYKFNNTGIIIDKNIKIIGKGSAKNVIIDAKNQGGIFKIVKNGNLTLINITLLNVESSDGGAISNNGILYIKDSIFKNNSHDSVFDKSGGAIYNTGRANIVSTVFSNNYADLDGGAIYNKGYINIKYSSFLKNSVSLDGAAIYNVGTANIKSTIFKGNDGFFGGAIYNSGKLNINNSVFKGNSAYDSGAIENNGKATIRRSTFSENSANSYGGAISNTGKLNVNNSVFKKNSAENSNAIFNSGRLFLYKSRFKDNYYKGFSLTYFNKEEISKNNFIIKNSDKGKIIAKLNIFSGTEAGVYSDYNSHCLFENNKFKGLETAIYIEGNHSKIRLNKIYSCFNGIVINGQKNIISKNTILKSKYKRGFYDIKKSKSNKISKNNIDKFIIDYNSAAPIKKSKSKKNLIIIHWKAYGSSKSVIVFSYYSRGKYKSTTKKTIIEKITKNKLKITSQGNVNYIKTKYSSRFYYLKIYKPKMLKNTIKKGIFDYGSGYIPQDSYSFKSSWRAKINGEKIVIYENCNGYGFLKNSYLSIKGAKFKRNIVIERFENGLKFTIKTKYIKSSIYHNKTTEDVYYLKKNLNPLEYYLKVYKSTIVKNSPNNPKSGIPHIPAIVYSLPPGHSCMGFTTPNIVILNDYVIGDLYYIQGTFNDSGVTVSWNITRPINGTIVIEKNCSGSKYNESFTTKIETFGLNTLKITIFYLDGEEKVDFVETNLTAENYFREIYKEKIDNELKNLANVSVRWFGAPWFLTVSAFTYDY